MIELNEWDKSCTRLTEINIFQNPEQSSMNFNNCAIQSNRVAQARGGQQLVCQDPKNLALTLLAGPFGYYSPFLLFTFFLVCFQKTLLCMKKW